MRFHYTKSWCCCVCVCMCVRGCACVTVFSHMILCSFYHLSFHQGSYTLGSSCSRPATCLLPPDAPRGGGGGVGRRRGGGRQWHKCPIVNTASLSLEETITWGHQKISYDINPASSASPPAPIHTHAHMHASGRLPIIPLLQITSHFHEQLRQSNRWRVWSVCGSCQDPLCLSFTPSTLLLGAQKKLTWVF